MKVKYFMYIYSLLNLHVSVRYTVHQMNNDLKLVIKFASSTVSMDLSTIMYYEGVQCSKYTLQIVYSYQILNL